MLIVIWILISAVAGILIVVTAYLKQIKETMEDIAELLDGEEDLSIERNQKLDKLITACMPVILEPIIQPICHKGSKENKKPCAKKNTAVLKRKSVNS